MLKPGSSLTPCSRLQPSPIGLVANQEHLTSERNDLAVAIGKDDDHDSHHSQR